MFNKYLNGLRYKHFENTNKSFTYISWLYKWKLENPVYYDIINENDTFYSELGCKIIDILKNSDMIKLVLHKGNSYDKYSYYIITIVDEKLMSNRNKDSVINLPAKLPMICKPKPYGKEYLGGYLLNSHKFSEDLFTEKKAYAMYSELAKDNNVYSMVNRLSNVSFKINKRLLEFIDEFGEMFNLVVNPDIKHKFANFKKKTKYQKAEFAFHNSKIILQETSLGIAEFYAKYNKIYFPLRLDQRGRLYCSPYYLNYQSSELANSLLLFAEAGTIHKDNVASINYFKFYGVNCFGGVISKASINSKIEWVDKNLNNILNYDNGILLKDAKLRKN